MPHKQRLWLQQAIFVALAGLLPLAALELAQFTFGPPFSIPNFLLRWFFVATLIAAALRLRRQAATSASWAQGRRLLLLAAVLILAGLRTFYTYNDSAAAIALWVFFLLLVQVDLVATWSLPWWQRLPIAAALAGVGGLVPVVASQLESHFADEEFFVAVQAALLSLFFFLLLLLCRWALARAAPPAHDKSALTLRPRSVLAALLISGLVGAPFILRAYQTSFYPPTAPPYPGISPDQPFLCGTLSPTVATVEEATVEGATADGGETFQALLVAIDNSAYKETPDYGMLALGRQDESQAEAFRKHLLQDMQAARYTGPVNSVKWNQHAAALRAYYFDRVHATFPNLFSAGELAQIKGWFAAINRRALTVEWVDWMYAAAFTFWPQGPYENQETGAGLLAILEATELADPALRTINQEYLARNRRGWSARFRNTDDTYIYQFEWITNARFQRLYTGDDPSTNGARSFEWILLQVLPDGSAPYYNHIGRPSLAPISYLGASLEQDPRYIWLAAQSLQQPLAKYGFIRAEPGAEQGINLSGQAPTQGSCLLYGDSGLPNQIGPLAPDKIVFRTGWTDTDAYLLLNLRFSGWHRYKATNAVALVYQGERIIADVLEAEPIRWLPVGRSLFRDKRIPRENLNGLLIENSGLSAALYWLTGIGSAWAQDPPHAAEVIDFQTGQMENGLQVDRSHTRVTGWRGWGHDRWISFYADGPLVVIDRATGPTIQRAGLTWHLLKTAERTVNQGRIQVRAGEHSLSLQLVNLDSPASVEGIQVRANGNETTLHYTAPKTGQLSVASLFLPGEWANAAVQVDTTAIPPVLRITQGNAEIVIVLPER